MTTIAAGELNRRMTVMAYSDAPRADGGITKAETNLGQRWASIEPLSGREYMEAAQMGSEVTHRIRLRYFDGLTTKHHLTYGGRTFNIVSMLDLNEGGVVHELMCKEVG